MSAEYSKATTNLLEKYPKFSITEQEKSFDAEMGPHKKKIFILVGPPAAGKSTWISNTFNKNKPYIISRDDIVELVASEYGWTYSDLFITPPKDAKLGEIDAKYGTVISSPRSMHWSKTSFSKVVQANEQIQNKFNQRVAGANKSAKDIVVDMTNMTSKSRKYAQSAIRGSEDDYEKIAVVFEFRGAEDLIQKISHKRAEAAKRMGKSKNIPSDVFRQMFNSFQEISSSEGFDKVISVDNRLLFKQILADIPNNDKVTETKNNMKKNKKKIQKEQLDVSVPQTRSSSAPPAVNQKAANNRAKMGQTSPTATKINDPNTLEGRQNILKDFIMSSKEIYRAANTIEKNLTKLITQEEVDKGLIAFIQDVGVFIEPNLVKLRDTIVPTAYQHLKKATSDLVQAAKQAKQSSQPPPAPQAAPAAKEHKIYTKQSLKEVFGMFGSKKLKGGAPWPSKDVIEQIRLVNNVSETFHFGMANNPNKPAHGGGADAPGSPEEHFIVIARWLFNGDPSLKSTDAPRVEARWHRKDESMSKDLESLTAEDYFVSWAIIQPKEYGGNKAWRGDEAGAQQAANAMKTSWAKWRSEENRGAARHGI